MMKAFKNKFAILTTFIIAIAMFTVGFVMVNSKASDAMVSNEIVRKVSADEIPDRTIVTATSGYWKPVKSGSGDPTWVQGVDAGDLEINSIPLEMNGESQYSFITGTKAITLKALPKEFYKFVGFVVTGIDEINDISNPITANPYTISQTDFTSEEVTVQVIFELETFELELVGRFWNDLNNEGINGNSIAKTNYFNSVGMKPYTYSNHNMITYLGDWLYLEDSWGVQRENDGTGLWDNSLAEDVDAVRWVNWYIWSNEGYWVNYGHARGVGGAYVNYDFLREYADNGKVTFVGSYAETIKVNIKIDSDFAGSSTDGVISILPTTYVTGAYTYGSYPQLNDFWMDKGSRIVIQAGASRFYNFDHYEATLGGGSASGTEYTIAAANSEVDITVYFTKKAYNISITGIDSDGNPVNTTGKASFTTTNSVAGKISIFDSLTGINFEGLSGYAYHDTFSVKYGSSWESINLGDTFDEDFLNRYLISGEIVLYVNLVVMYKVNIVIPKVSEGMGYYEIYYEGETDPTNDREFEKGKVIIIKAYTENDYYMFRQYTNIIPALNEDPFNETLTITINKDRTINLYFMAKAVNLAQNPNINGNGSIEISDTSSIKIGDVIYITIDTDYGYDIKSVTINGKKYTVANGLIMLTATENFLNAMNSNYVLKVDVTTGMEAGLLVTILAPSILIPALLAIFIVFAVVNNKRKKFIRSQLTDELKAQVTLNASQFISDLKAGKNVGQVTDADVKKAMKERKKKK